MVLPPISEGALTAHWKGHYPVLQKTGSVNYVVDIKGSRKRERTFHFNMLNDSNTATENVHFAAEGEEGEEAEEENIPEWRGGEYGEPKMCNQLAVGLTEGPDTETTA